MDKEQTETEYYDVAIVGSGGAGLRAALAAVSAGARTVVLSKTFFARSATVCAQGGINAALGQADSLARHARDTFAGSYALADAGAVRFFVEQAIPRIRELAAWGLPFSRDEAGLIAQRPFGGGSFPRTCFAADRTGQAVLHTLIEQCLRHEVEIWSDCLMLDIAVADGQAAGLTVYDMKHACIRSILSKTVVLATGGAGRIYGRYTTNPYASTGDGMAAALRAGLALRDPEFIQFHPTGLAGKGILISEAARAEGGILLNKDGRRFMADYDARGELATRDVVARAIAEEISAGRGWGCGQDGAVQLDLRHLGRARLAERLPQVVRLAERFAGVDLAAEPLLVQPVCHYFMGGIDVQDYHTGATGVSGIFAAGECACMSIHGANRLGGNSLAETVVFGEAAGRGAAAFAAEALPVAARRQSVREQTRFWQERFTSVTGVRTGCLPVDLQQELAAVMHKSVGLFRQEGALCQAAVELDRLQADYEKCVVGDSSLLYNMAFRHYVELGNMLAVARAVVQGAIYRRESRGSHFRSDYPHQDDSRFKCHTVIKADGSLMYRKVADAENG